MWGKGRLVVKSRSNCKIFSPFKVDSFWKIGLRAPFGMFHFRNIPFRKTLPSFSFYNQATFCTIQLTKNDNDDNENINNDNRIEFGKIYQQTEEITQLSKYLSMTNNDKIDEITEHMKENLLIATDNNRGELIEPNHIQKYLPQYDFKSVKKILLFYLRNSEYQKFLSFFNILSERVHFDSNDYNQLFIEINKSEKQKSSDFKHKIKTFQPNADKFSSVNYVLDKLFDDISKKSIIIDQRTLVSLLTFVVTTQRDMIKAKYIFQLMLNSGISPDLRAINTVLIGHVQTGQVDLAYRIYKYMILIGMTPPHKTILLLISYLTKNNQLEESNELLKDLGRFNYPVTSDAYAPLLSLYFKKGNEDQVDRLLQYLSSKKIPIDEITYSAIINGYVKMGQLSKAQSVLEEMKVNRVNPTQAIQTNLMEGFIKYGKTTQALEIFNQIQNPDIVSYTLLISGLIDSQPNTAETLYHNMIEKSKILPNAKTFEKLIYGFLKLKNYEKAKFYFQQSRQYNITLDTKLLSTLPTDF